MAKPRSKFKLLGKADATKKQTKWTIKKRLKKR